MDKVGLSSFRERFETTSCRGVLAMLDRTLPANQRAWCEGNHLAVDMVYPAPERGKLLSRSVLCPLLYREMANFLKFLANEQTAPLDILERVEIVRLKLIHPQVTIYAVVLGKHLVEISTIAPPLRLAEHLKTTVRVQEFPSTCY